MLTKNKKANMWATMLLPVLFIFIFGLLTFIGFSLYTEFYQGFQDSGLLTPEGITTFERMGAGILMLDWISVIVVVVMIIASTWILSKEDHSPVEFVAAWVMIAFVGFIGYCFSYMFGQLLSEQILYNISLMFPRMTVLGTNAHWLALGGFIMSQVFIYNKRKQSEVGNEPI